MAAWAAVWIATAARPEAPGTLVGRLPGVGAAAVQLLGLAVWPAPLHLERFVPVTGWSPGAAAGLWLLVAAAGAALATVARATRGGGLLLALALLAWVPASGFVPVYPAIADRWLFAAEHVLYVPLCGLVPLVAAVAARRLPKRVAAGATLALLAVWTPLTIARNRDWRDEETLFRHTLRWEPPAARVWYNLGNLRLAAGDPVEAERLYREAAARAPRDGAVRLNLGVALHRQGRREEAAAAWAEAVRLDPGLAGAFRR
jgi:tetratricopeptide (TPR) repeat protein